MKNKRGERPILGHAERDTDESLPDFMWVTLPVSRFYVRGYIYQDEPDATAHTTTLGIRVRSWEQFVGWCALVACGRTLKMVNGNKLGTRGEGH